jgi:hypothetical protein
MIRGQSIRIFLADGSVTGIRHAEVVNWTGQAVACPRSRMGELGEWEEAQRPGVYLLFGIDDATARPAVYVGEAENVYSRLQDHLSRKEFWNEVIVFTNKDENLTKAHVRFLEQKLVESATTAKRYLVTNSVQPQGSRLPRGDRDSMESFFEQIRMLLGVLGHRVLEAVTASSEPARHASARPPEPGITAGTLLFLRTKAVEARAMLTDEGIVVLAGSKAAPKISDSLSVGYQKLRNHLLEQRIVTQDGDQLVFQEDHLFSSPSTAAAVIVGYMINGRDAWRSAGGVSVGQLETAVASANP